MFCYVKYLKINNYCFSLVNNENVYLHKGGGHTAPPNFYCSQKIWICSRFCDFTQTWGNQAGHQKQGFTPEYAFLPLNVTTFYRLDI